VLFVRCTVRELNLPETMTLVLPATLDEDEDDTMSEHHFVNMLSPWWSSVAA
jgi:hypothetical protein